MDGTSYIDLVQYFPPEITINIFKMLNAESLLTASLVSKDWYELIANSQECMRKIKVSFKCTHSRSFTYHNIALLLRSSRKYENLEISRCFMCINYVQGLFQQTKKKWKRVKIIKTTFNNSNQTLDYLRGIEKSVEELILDQVHVTNMDKSGTVRQLTFPKLETLHAKHFETELFYETFENIKSLKTFDVCSFGQSVASLDALTELLKNNHKLRSLMVSGNVFDKIMYQSEIVSDFKFKLVKLSINNNTYNSTYHNVVQQNFVKFLKSQSSSLRTLSFGNWLGLDALKTAYQLQNLKFFTVKGLSNIQEIIEWKYIKMPTNKSILKLSILNAPNNVEVLKTLTEALPNLTCFLIYLKGSQSYAVYYKAVKK